MSIEHSLLFLVLIIAAAKIAGELAELLGQPAVLGEMLVGVLLTFTALRSAPGDHALMFIGTIGIILLLFEVGLESELEEFVKVGKSAALVAVTGVLLPLGAGFAVAYALLGDTRYALFLGATLTATSVGITARVLSDMRRTNSKESKIILGAAVIDDILGLLALSIVLGITTTGSIDLQAVGRALSAAVVFLVAAVWIGIRFANVLIPFGQHLRTRGVLVSVSFVFCITLALIAEELGLAAIIGAFAAGLVLASTDDRVKIQRQIKPLADIFIPVFFVLVGLQVNLASMNPLEAGGRRVLLVGLVLLIVAVVTKLVSGFGVSDKDTSKLAVGIGMVPRGEVGLIFASIGLQQKVIPEGLYSALVLIVVASTLVTPPFLKWAFRNVEPNGGPAHEEEPGEAVVSEL